MKLTIARDEFVQGLARAHGVADRRSSMPVLANVLLETEGPGGLRISATDLHLGITGIVPARVDNGGATTAAARTLFDIVRNLPQGEVSLSVDDNQWLEVRCGRVHYRIAGIPAEDFPELPASEEVEFFCLDADLLSSIIEQTYFSISTDEGRPHLNGALFQGEGSLLRMVATDGHRLCLIEKNIADSEAKLDFSMLVPLKAILELRRLLDEGAGDIEVGAAGPNAFFRRNLAGSGEGVETEITMSVKLVEARFPPYGKVIPKTTERDVIVERQLLLEALRRASLISRDKSAAVRIVFGENRIIVASDNPDVGEASEEIDAEYSGEKLTMGFNGRYFMETLAALDAGRIMLSLNGSTDACVVKPAEETGFIGVVMPMRL